MEEKDLQELRRKVDDVLDIYFEELANCLEKRKDMQCLRGWLRANLHEVIIRTNAVKESVWSKYMYHGVIALLVISIVNMILIFFRYIYDTV